MFISENSRGCVGFKQTIPLRQVNKTKKRRNKVVNIDIELISPILPEISSNHKDINIGIDIMFINSIPFMTSISQIVAFGTATEMEGSNMDNTVSVLKVINATYKLR